MGKCRSGRIQPLLHEWRGEMKKALIFLMLCMMFAGCANARKYANLSSGVIGCNPDEIDIEHATLIAVGGVHSWEAICKGKRYVCRYQSTSGVQCVEKFIPFVPEGSPSDTR